MVHLVSLHADEWEGELCKRISNRCTHKLQTDKKPSQQKISIAPRIRWRTHIAIYIWCKPVKKSTAFGSDGVERYSSSCDHYMRQWGMRKRATETVHILACSIGVTVKCFRFLKLFIWLRTDISSFSWFSDSSDFNQIYVVCKTTGCILGPFTCTRYAVIIIIFANDGWDKRATETVRILVCR